MIPVLGVPILNRFDLLEQMFETVDVEVHQTVVVDNGGVVPPAWLADPWPGLHVIAPGFNLGVAASWNLIIRSTPEARWWLIVNNDIVFAPGQLAHLEEEVERMPWRLWMLGTMSAFTISQVVLEKVGWFDENFVPGYFEDNDFAYRCALASVPVVDLGNLPDRAGSATIDSSLQYRRENNRTFPHNRAYYLAKWGGMPGQETFTTPFNAGGDIRGWALDYRRVRDLSWKPLWGQLRIES